MMGRGADGGCGTEERPCPVSRASFSALSGPSGRSAVDPYAQVRKALTDRSPFAGEEESSRVATLPVVLATSLARHGDGRKRKTHTGEHGKKAAHPPLPVAMCVWYETEEYFRSVTLSDIDLLEWQFPSAGDLCLRIPLITPAESEREFELRRDVGSGIQVEEAKGGAVQVEETEVGAAVVITEPNEVVQEQEDMEIDEIENKQRISDDAAVPLEVEMVEEEHGSLLNWLLGSRYRALLASEQPNKKQKLLGNDAGLERVLRLPPEEGVILPLCDYCCNQACGGKSGWSGIMSCRSCEATVHRRCYGIQEEGAESWTCARCKYLEEVGRPMNGDEESPCLLCPKEVGVLKPLEDDGNSDEGVKFAHLFCSLWMPDLYVEREETMGPIMNFNGIPENRMKLVCNVCKVKHRACVRCSNGACRSSFHPSCARGAKHKMEIWRKFQCDNAELRVFCAKHSDIQGGSPRLKYLNVANGTTSRIINIPPAVSSVVNPIANTCVAENDKQIDEDPTTAHPQPDQRESLLEGSMRAAILLSDGDPPQLLKFVLLLKKLTEKGDVTIHDASLGTGISSDAIDSAIQGDFSNLSPEMRLKLIKWVHDRVCTVASPKNVKPDYDVEVLRVKEIVHSAFYVVKDFEGSDAINIVEGENSNVIVKSLPPRRRTRCNVGIKENEATTPLSGMCVQEHIQKICDETADIPTVLNNGMNEDCAYASVADGNCSKENETKSLCAYDDSSNTIPTSFKEQRHEKVNVGSNMHHREGHVIESVPCSEIGLSRPIEVNEKLFFKDITDVTGPGFGATEKRVATSTSASYVHTWILKKLVEIVPILLKLNSSNNGLIGYAEIPSYKSKHTSGTCRHLSRSGQEVVFEKSKDGSMSKMSLLAVLAKAKELGITHHPPEDELEGEIVNLQNKLLVASLTLKFHYDNLILKVVSGIPDELNASKKQRWDTVLVNRFLRDVREAKKRGRKERRQREAHAVLAAATAAAASSRVLPLRKDAKEETRSVQEQHRKEKPPKLDVSKLSIGKHSDLNVIACDVCKRQETLMKPVFVCAGCKVAVHLDCYHMGKDPISSWYCEFCELLKSDSFDSGLVSECREKFSSLPHCGLCGTTTGAFRKSTNGKWVHAFCAEWALGSRFRRGQEQPVEGVDSLLKTKELLNCCICHQNTGICIKCFYGHCQTAFHPICARAYGLFLNVRLVGGNIQHKAYCEKHSLEQREKAEFQYGAEELKNLRQTRVELERLRLLCERIIKREKLKRESAVLSHDILSSRRDYVAMSLISRSPFFSSGFSSESATTSINNTSYSGAMDRSDDVTVDSTLSGKRRAIPPFHIKLDRSSVRSSLEANDRTSFSGMQLSQRPASYDKTMNEGKKPSKRRKV